MIARRNLGPPILALTLAALSAPVPSDARAVAPAAALTSVEHSLGDAGGTANTGPLTIGTWGGPYEAAQKSALFDPYTAHSGTPIDTLAYQGGLAVFDAARVPDVLDMIEEDAIAACDRGSLERLDPADFIDRVALTDEALLPCAVAHLTFSTLVAFDESAFPGEKPRRIDDLFDVQRFPGKRALQRSAAAIFEWAMLAEGVPPSQVYDLLSTERGLRLVRRQLERLRGSILWWSDPAEAVELLISGKASMASGYNGRFFDAWAARQPIGIIWDGQIIDRSVWAIPAEPVTRTTAPGSGTSDRDKADPAVGKARIEAATDFIRFAVAPVRQAALARHIPYGPTHPAAFDFIGLNPETGIVMSDHLPTAAHHLRSALFRDSRWYARTEALRRRHFEAWLVGTEP